MVEGSQRTPQPTAQTDETSLQETCTPNILQPISTSTAIFTAVLTTSCASTITRRTATTKRGEGPRQMIVTVPALPSTVIIAPCGIRRVASVTDTTHGRPISRDTMTA